MTDDEQRDPGKTRSTTSTPRVIKHQQRTQILLQLVERATLSDPALRQELARAMASVLAEDPDLAAAFGATFAPGARGPTASVSLSPLATTLNNVLNVPGYVLNETRNVLNGAPGRAAVGRVAPSPAPSAPSEVPPSHTLPPPTSPTTLTLTPTEGPLAGSAGADRRGREQDECFERLHDLLYPGFKGDYRRLDADPRLRLNTALSRIRAKMDEQGIPLERRPDAISYAFDRLPNYSKQRTAMALNKYWSECIAGVDRNGRDNGTVRHHHLYLNESASVKHRRGIHTTTTD